MNYIYEKPSEMKKTKSTNIITINENPFCMKVYKTVFIRFFFKKIVPISWLTYISNKRALKANAQHPDRK